MNEVGSVRREVRPKFKLEGSCKEGNQAGREWGGVLIEHEADCPDLAKRVSMIRPARQANVRTHARST